MARYDDLLARMHAGDLILIDGATGSETVKRGVPELPNGWAGGAASTHPDVVRAVHDDYLAIGADLIVANTFAAGRNILADAGVPEQFETVNRQAVEIAVAARDDAPAADHVVVAAGISNWSFTGERLDLDRLYDDTVAQAMIMRDAGAEFLSLEMMVDIERFEVTLAAAATVGLPLWVGFSIGPEEGCEPSELGDPVPLRDGGLLADAVDHVVASEVVDAVCLMHSDIRLVGIGLDTIRSRWTGPLGAYGHAAEIIDGEWVFHDALTPEEYAVHVPAWLALGATMIGGCCGMGPEHLRLVAAALEPA